MISVEEVDTLKPDARVYKYAIGQRTGLSFGDVKLANFMYNCNSKCCGISSSSPWFMRYLILSTIAENKCIPY